MHGGELYIYKVSTADVRKQLAKIGPGIWRLKQVLKLLDAPLVVYEVWAVEGGGETFFLAPQRDGIPSTEVIEIEESEHRRAKAVEC